MIRDADPSLDAPSCLAIYAPFVTESPVSFELVVPSEAEFADRIRRSAAANPWLVLEDGGELSGFAYASTHRERAAYRFARDVSVYVDPAFHRRGVGRALYVEVFARLRAQGIRWACAGITLPNDASVGLHEALGFEQVGVYRQIGWKAGAWHDVGWWQLDLGAAGDGAPAEPTGPRR